MIPRFSSSFTSVWNESWHVEIENIGEGLKGDYRPEEEGDVPLLRFRILCRNSVKENWREPNFNSFCTLIDWRVVETNIVNRARVLLKILERIACLEIDDHLKPHTEGLSWMNTQEFVHNFPDDRVYVIGGKELMVASFIDAKHIPKVKLVPKCKVKVLVIVSGGMVTAVRASDPTLSVEVLDWDCVREGDTFHDLRESGAIETLVDNEWEHEVF